MKAIEAVCTLSGLHGVGYVVKLANKFKSWVCIRGEWA